MTWSSRESWRASQAAGQRPGAKRKHVASKEGRVLAAEEGWEEGAGGKMALEGQGWEHSLGSGQWRWGGKVVRGLLASSASPLVVMCRAAEEVERGLETSSCLSTNKSAW